MDALLDAQRFVDICPRPCMVTTAPSVLRHGHAPVRHLREAPRKPGSDTLALVGRRTRLATPDQPRGLESKNCSKQATPLTVTWWAGLSWSEDTCWRSKGQVRPAGQARIEELLQGRPTGLTVDMVCRAGLRWSGLIGQACRESVRRHCMAQGVLADEAMDFTSKSLKPTVLGWAARDALLPVLTVCTPARESASALSSSSSSSGTGSSESGNALEDRSAGSCAGRRDARGPITLQLLKTHLFFSFAVVSRSSRHAAHILWLPPLRHHC